MAIYGHICLFVPNKRRGDPSHIYLDKQQAALLDAIRLSMGKRRLGVIASRSQLIHTAIRNFISDCEAEEDLREAMKDARAGVANRTDSVSEEARGSEGEL